MHTVTLYSRRIRLENKEINVFFGGSVTLSRGLEKRKKTSRRRIYKFEVFEKGSC